MSIPRASLAFTFAAVLAACGGGGGSDAPAPTSPLANEPLGIRVLAGVAGGTGNVDGTGAEARFGSIRASTLDAEGNLYVADSDNALVRKVTPGGVVTTVAGQRTVRQFALPAGIARDAAGNLYLSDITAVRKVDGSGAITTLAGQLPTCTPGVQDNHGTVACQDFVPDTASGFADGAGATARFRDAGAVALDAAGNVYVLDRGNHAVRKITPAGVVSTLAGTGAAGSADGNGAAAAFGRLADLAVAADGTVYLTESDGGRVRKITPAGDVTTLATGLASPRGIAFDPDGNLLVANGGDGTVRKVTPMGAVTTLFTASPRGGEIEVDAAGNILSGGFPAVDRITPAGVQTVLAGLPLDGSGPVDGVGTAARFDWPGSVAVDAAGNAFVVDGTQKLRRITPAGEVSTLAYSGNAHSVAVDPDGNVVLVQPFPTKLVKFTQAGATSTLAGGCEGYQDGPALDACFFNIGGIAYNAAGDAFIADGANKLLRKLDRSGMVSTVAGRYGIAGGTDGPRDVATFMLPNRVAVDLGGNVYVTESTRNTIRKVTPAGEVSTVLGSTSPALGDPGSCDYADGTVDVARFCNGIGDIGFDHRGNLYVLDAGNRLIRKVTPDGFVSTVAGTFGLRGLRTGALPGSLPTMTGMIVAPQVPGDDRVRLIVSTTERVVLRITLP